MKLLLTALTAWLLLLSPTAMAETRTFPAIADASVPAPDHGTAPRLTVAGHARRAYLKFDVDLPAGATVTAARLRLFATTLAPAGTSVWRAGSRWSERRLNRRNRPAVTGRRLSRDRRPQRGWRALAVRVAATGSRTFVLSGHGRALSRYHSREGAHAPHLVVSYTTLTSAPARPPLPVPCPVARPQTTWRAPGSPPLADAAAAACVTRSGENRPQNAQPNAKAPTAAELDLFRSARDSAGRTPAEYNRNFGRVTGAAPRYGLRSTDDLIEWAAYKWGVPEDLVRGQMVMESGWSMLQKGDRHDWATPVASLYPTPAVIDSDSVWESLGIAQIRWRHTVPWNPGVEPLRWQSTAFALDYSQALIRYYFDGYCDWCGAGYAAGDPDGAYRTYVSGSFSDGQWYADGVRSNAESKPWEPIPDP